MLPQFISQGIHQLQVALNPWQLLIRRN